MQEQELAGQIITQWKPMRARETEYCRRHVHLCPSLSNKVSQSFCVTAVLDKVSVLKEQLYSPPPPRPLPYMCEDSWSGSWGWSQSRAVHNCLGADRNKEDGAQHPPPVVWDPRFFCAPSAQTPAGLLHTVHSSSHHPATPPSPFPSHFHRSITTANCVLFHPPVQRHIQIPNDTRRHPKPHLS